MAKRTSQEENFYKILKDIPFHHFSQIVEMGVGRGSLSLALKNFYPHLYITVVDRNIEAFKKQCNKKIVNFNLLKEDIRYTSIPSESIDCVCYYKLLHHLSVEEIFATLKEAFRILRREGFLLIIDELFESQNKAQENLLKIYEIEREIDVSLGETPEKMYLPSEIINFLHKSNFIIVNEKVYLKNNPSFICMSDGQKMIRLLIKKCQNIKEDEKKSYIFKELKNIKKKIDIFGIEPLPVFKIFAQKTRIHYDIKKQE